MALAVVITLPVARASRMMPVESVQVQGIEAVLCAPLGHPSIGVLYLAGGSRAGFDDAHRAHAEIFARHLAPLVERLLDRDDSARAFDHTAPLRSRLRVDRIAGRSKALAETLRALSVAAQVHLPVLVTGESGTGKSAFARALHDSSPRASGPFVEVNCAAIPEALFESELFGAEKGAHSTATRRIEGKVDGARGGTLLLDEIGEMPLPVQSKLLMFLQSFRYYRLGSNTPIQSDARVVAATNADLEELVRAKRFREDLYYRLNVLPVRVPPLRERREDVAAIAEIVVRALAEASDRTVTLARSAQIALEESEWPGNVRQLENVLQRAWAVASSEGSSTIEPRHVFPERGAAKGRGDGAAAGAGADEQETYEDATRGFQRAFLEQALARHEWNVSETARRVGMARSHLNDLIRAHGLTRAR
jgi:DNA-binding NtrC family response regulator